MSFTLQRSPNALRKNRSAKPQTHRLPLHPVARDASISSLPTGDGAACPRRSACPIPIGIMVAHADVHEGIADEAVAVSRVLAKTLAQARVGERVSCRVLQGIDHELGRPAHVGF